MIDFLSIDLPPLLAALFAAISCALLGNYLVLRKISLMGDAISHSVLPGVVVAFLLSGSRAGGVMFLGAAIAGILSALLIEGIRRFGKVESGASMGVVFSLFFAVGIIAMEQAAARSVDLDADCLLHGQLESIFWYPPLELSRFFSWSTLALIPSEVVIAFLTMLLTIGFLKLFSKELLLSSFDPELSTSLGFSSTLLYQLLMVVVACAVVASFRIVGSILVISMLISPAASARFYTERMKTQLVMSVFFAAITVFCGYTAGAFGPLLFGYEHSVSIAGMIAVSGGVLLVFSSLLAPQRGVLARKWRQRRLALAVRSDDILALLYRTEEQGGHLSRSKLLAHFFLPKRTAHVLRQLLAEGLIEEHGVQLSLTPSGKARAEQCVRSHRLWESYLVETAAVDRDHVHPMAERLEHFNTEELEGALEQALGELPTKDPHGKEIP